MSDETKNEVESIDVEPLSDEDLESASGGAAEACSWDDCSNSSLSAH
ncbi:MAG: hypothetical protein AAGN66_13365 [Acidobacteriota bacterium]